MSGLGDPEEFRRQVLALTKGDQEIVRPSHWNVYEVTPDEIEVLRFSEDRIHVRTRYVRSENRWIATRLSP